MSLATLGDVVFEVSADRVRTWHEAKRSGEARWVDHDVHGARPASEFLGPGLDTITLPVRLDAAFGLVPKEELRKLRELRDTGAVLAFVIGGEPAGDFSLRGLGEEWRRFDAHGVLTAAEIEITLKEYH